MRKTIIDEAMTWLRTPYHHRANVKGAGVDCLFLIIEVYVACGLLPRPAIPEYPEDVMMHRGEETMLNGFIANAKEVEHPKPGDVALWKFGRIFSHGAIVIDWPQIIHAHRPERCVVLSDGSSGLFHGREVKFYSMLDDAE